MHTPEMHGSPSVHGAPSEIHWQVPPARHVISSPFAEHGSFASRDGIERFCELLQPVTINANNTTMHDCRMFMTRATLQRTCPELHPMSRMLALARVELLVIDAASLRGNLSVSGKPDTTDQSCAPLTETSIAKKLPVKFVCTAIAELHW